MPRLTKRSYGCNPDRPGLYRRMRFGAQRLLGLPTSQPRFNVGLPPIWDQGGLGSCTAHGLLRAYLFAAFKAQIKQEMLSRLMLYYDERVIEGTTASDAGAAIADGVQTLQTQGSCLEKNWPYVEGQFATAPPATAYAEAKSFELLKAAKVDAIPAQIKAVLAAGWPVVIGFTCYPGLESDATAQSGVVPFPAPGEQPIGGHCVALNGFYDDAKQLFGFDNSWNNGWGKNGSGYLPYDYFTNGLVSDCWVLYTVEGELPAPTPTPAPTPAPPAPTPTPTPGPAPAPEGKLITVDQDTVFHGVDIFTGHTDLGRKVHGVYL